MRKSRFWMNGHWSLTCILLAGLLALSASPASGQTYNVDVGRDCARQCDAIENTCQVCPAGSVGNVFDEGSDDNQCCGQPQGREFDAVTLEVIPPGLVMNLDWFFDQFGDADGDGVPDGLECFGQIDRHGHMFISREPDQSGLVSFNFDAHTADGKNVTYGLRMSGRFEDANNWLPAPGTGNTISLEAWLIEVLSGPRKNACQGQGSFDCIDATTGLTGACDPADPDHNAITRAHIAALCGDTVCDAGEECACDIDCGIPPSTEISCSDGLDDDCDGAVDCNDSDCAADPACETPPPACNDNGICEPGEDCNNCPSDCDGVQSGKPSNRYCCGNGILEGPEGDGTICNGNP